MCCLCLLEIYMTLVLEILSAITDVHHQAGLLHACLYVGSVDEDRGGHQCVVTFGFKHGWTKADVFDAWSLTGNIGSCLTCDMRTLLVISTTSECKQNAVSAVGAT